MSVSAFIFKRFTIGVVLYSVSAFIFTDVPAVWCCLSSESAFIVTDTGGVVLCSVSAFILTDLTVVSCCVRSVLLFCQNYRRCYAGFRQCFYF